MPMKPFYLVLLVSLTGLAGCQPAPAAGTYLTHLDQKVVQENFGDFKGCFLLRDLASSETFRWGDRCDAALPPCSTFKVVNALVGLETGVLQSEDSLFRWDGSEQPFRSWAQDHTLTSAFRHSVLWYFQRVALAVGKERMERLLGQLDYGNRRMGENLARFWIDGSLTVTADDQLDLMTLLYRNELPLAKRTQELVRGLMNQPDGHGGLFGGKTGTCRIDGKLKVGWFVGHLERGNLEAVFVTLIESDDDTWGHMARKISRKILDDLP
jgi:beta-lactamase class D